MKKVIFQKYYLIEFIKGCGVKGQASGEQLKRNLNEAKWLYLKENEKYNQSNLSHIILVNNKINY